MSYKKTTLQSWLNPFHLQQNKIKEYQRIFFQNKPFPHLELKQLFKQEKVKALLEALKMEKFGFRESDLYTFFQTNDFSLTQNKLLQEFRTFLSSPEFISLLSAITGEKLKENSIDLSASVYERTHHLLPHDDQVEGRKIAYSFYLTSLREEDGGALALYTAKQNKPTKITQRLVPEENAFAIFLVSKISFHEVEEVLADKQRIAISGWFHGD